MARLFNRVARWISARLQRKFIVLLGLGLIATSVFFLSVVVGVYKSRLVDEHARASMQVNRLLQVSLENAMLKRDLDGLRKIVGKLGAEEDISSVMILSPQLEVRFSSNSAQIGERLDTDTITSALESGVSQTRFITGSSKTELLRSVIPVHNRDACQSCHGDMALHPVNGLLVVDYKAESIKTEARKSAVLLGLIGVAVIFAAGAGIWVTLHWLVISRLGTLQRFSGQFAAGRLEARTGLTGEDEIAQLGTSFDNMAEELGHTLAGLNAAETFLQNVIDSIPDGVRVIDDDFNIIRANRAYCRQIDRPMSAVVGEKCYKSSHGNTKPCPVTLVTCPVAELSEKGAKNVKSTHQHITRDGGELFVEVSAARTDLTVNGAPLSCVIESIRDLSEQARLSHEQRLSEIGLLAAGVAHEIHNPLSSIQLALRAMQAGRQDASPRQGNISYLGVASDEIEKCLKVTDGLMKLSEPTGDDHRLVSLDVIVGEVFSLLSYQAEIDSIGVDLDMEDGLRAVASDSDMRMMTLNLAQNAFHAMPEGGKITVTGRHENGQIKLVFQDTGVGIAKSNLEKIFLPFWTKRADSSEGRGLGLSICLAIVERFGGAIAVKSVLGEGTGFTVLLPDADFVKA